MRTCVASIVAASLGAARPASAATTRVAAGGDLQAAINAAQPGDTILLAAGATFTGNFTLPLKSGTAVITIRSDADDSLLPSAGVRISPAFAAQLPKLQSGNASPALATAPGAHHYQMLFVEFQPNAAGAGDIITLGDGSSAQSSLAVVPHDLTLDRIYVHGDPSAGQKRGIALNSASTTIVNSYVADIKAIGQDSQAICGWNGPGPYTISNNYLEAAGENVMFGGADPSIPNLVPSDITFTRNYLSKPIAWKSQNWQVKNIFELKNAQRVVADSNVLEYNWEAAQSGYAVVFTPRNQDGTAPWSVVQTVQFTNNIVRHVANALNILGTDNINPSQLTNAITIRNNLFADVSSASYGGSGRLVQISGGAEITFDHNTAILDGWTAVWAYNAPTTHFTFANNIVPDNGYGILGDNYAPGASTINYYFAGGVITNDVFAGGPNGRYPSGNYNPATMNDVGFVDYAGGNYKLAASSAYATAATDGSAIGADVDAILTATSGVTNYTSAPSSTPPSTPTPPSPPPPPPAPPAPPSNPAPPAPPDPSPATTPAPDPSPAPAPQPACVAVSTGPVYEVPPDPGAYGFSDHGYYRGTGGWQETRLISAGGGTTCTAAPSATSTSTYTTVVAGPPVYEVPPPPGAYGFNDHGYYRPTGGWQETRMIAPGSTTTQVVSVVSPAAAAPSGIPGYQIAPPPGSYGFTDHGYYRPDGGWQSTSLAGAPAPQRVALDGSGAAASPPVPAGPADAVKAPAASIAAGAPSPAVTVTAAAQVSQPQAMAKSEAASVSISRAELTSNAAVNTAVPASQPTAAPLTMTPATVAPARPSTSRTWIAGSVATPPANPTPSDGALVNGDGVVAGWTGPLDATFDIYAGTTPDLSLVAAGVTGVAGTFSGLEPSTTYYWRIVAHTASGDAASATWRFTTSAR